MLTTESYDPVFFERLRREQPRLHPNHNVLVRIAHADGLEELARLDAALDQLTARRREIVDRVDTYRRRLWPNMTERQHRHYGRPGEIPMPPAPVDARPLWGRHLRRTAVAVLARHGAQSLRELHGLLHRYGYVLDSRRPVQRLADALAYEVRGGRVERLERGVYGLAAGAEAAVGRRSEVTDLPDAPLAWSVPSPDSAPMVDAPVIDVAIADDPERWSDGEWPAAAQLGSSVCAGPPDRDARALADDLDATVAATRARLAALVAERLGPPPHHLDRGSSDRARAAFDYRQQGPSGDVTTPDDRPSDSPDSESSEISDPRPARPRRRHLGPNP